MLFVVVERERKEGAVHKRTIFSIFFLIFFWFFILLSVVSSKKHHSISINFRNLVLKLRNSGDYQLHNQKEIFIPFTQNKEKKSRLNLFGNSPLSPPFSLSYSAFSFFSLFSFITTFFEPQKKPLLFSSLLLSLCHKKKERWMMKKNIQTKKQRKLFEGVEKGDEEVVKVLLLGNKNKQFELDINFQFKEKVFFLFKLNFSLSLSLFLSLLLFW